MTGSPNDRLVRLPELLAPAGDLETLKAAVANGADAVYLGAGSFNARQNATNFTMAELEEAVEYAHLHAVRVYLALNILVADDEGDAALELALNAWSRGIDAIILQDVGLAGILHRNLPDLLLFASTQMTIADEAGLRAAARLGISRVILPRELSMPEIGRLAELGHSLGLDTEVFVHGALCISYSGQCLLSSLIGGRSGNRGTCAQPCRLPWQIAAQSTIKPGAAASPILSPRDQALISWLPQLAAAGVTSLKIEGRMRGRAYVAQVVAAYRDALDQIGATGSLNPGQFERQLLQAFNRGGGFTDRYISGQYRDDFLTGSPVGSHGLLLGTITTTEPHRGILRLMPDASWPAEWLPGRGDVLSVRRTGADQEIASAPIGEISRQGRILMIKGFHPEVLAKLADGDPVYRMTDHQAEQQALRADRRRTALVLSLSGNSNEPAAIILSATIPTSPWRPIELTVQSSRPAEPVPPLQPERLAQQLRKTGSTPFHVLDIRLDGEVCLTIASLNEMRRQVLDELTNRLMQEGHRPIPKTRLTQWGESPVESSLSQGQAMPANQASQPQRRLSGPIAAYYHQLPEDPRQIACGADRYYLPGLGLDADHAPAVVQTLRQMEPGCQVLLWLPSAMTGTAAGLQREIITGLPAWGFDGLCAGHPGLDLLNNKRSDDQILVADAGANIFNQETLKYYAALGAAAACPSLELSSRRIELMRRTAAAAGIRLELPLYGRLRLMNSAYCPIGQNRPECRRCWQNDPAGARPDPGRIYYLFDRKHLAFPVLTHPRTCSSDIFSHFLLSAPQDLLDLLADSSDRLHLRLYFMEESLAERRSLTDLARQLQNAVDRSSAQAAADRFQELARLTAGRLNSQTGHGYYPQ